MSCAVRCTPGSWICNSRSGVRAELHKERAELHKEIGAVHEKIGDVHKEIGDVRKEITVQTRWLGTVIVAAMVLVPVMQKVLAALFP